MSETITAVSTPNGVGGISIIRMSGDKALNIALNIFSCNESLTNIKPRYMYLGEIKTQQFKEKALMVYFKNPHSYTGEDIIEFHCHGGTVITKGILNHILKNGAKLAQAGEFTKRAYLNGKITLDEAEGVIDMINAESESEVRAGYLLLAGKLSSQINNIQSELTGMLSQIEVALDYPEHDIEESTSKSVCKKLNNIKNTLTEILKTSSSGMLIKQGCRVAIIGKPNVGKSSIMNTLLNFNRSIVTDIAGTTRDTLEETFLYNGMKFVLIDTAGVRESNDVVEKIGVEKAKENIKSSDIVLFVIDASSPLDKQDNDIKQLINDKKHIIVANKSDLKINSKIKDLKEVVFISAKNEKGFKELKQKIYNTVINESIINNSNVIINARHTSSIQKAIESARSAIEGIKKGFSLDVVSIDIKNLWLALGEITGETCNEIIIDKIFSSFCVGK